MTTTAQQNERNSLLQLALDQGVVFDSTPGRYDGASDRLLATALDHLEADEEAGSVETTGLHLARFGRFIRTTDEQGFVDVVAFDTIKAAEAKLTEVTEVEAKLDEGDADPSLFESFAAAIKADQDFDAACRGVR